MIEFNYFKIKDIFSKPGKGDVDLQQSDINGKGEYFINSGETNYGIKGKTDRSAKIFPANTITIDFWEMHIIGILDINLLLIITYFRLMIRLLKIKILVCI